MIELHDVRKAFNQGRPNEFWAIRGVSLSLEANRITVLKGPSGSGKTTLLSMIKANGKDELLLSSVDNDKPILAGIYNDEIVGTAAYSSIAPARWCMSQMVNLLNGAPIPGFVFYENMTVTKDNVEEAFEHYYPGKTLKEYMAGETQ